MKLVIFIYSMTGGGAERVISYLLPHLKKNGVDVSLVLMNTIIKYEIPDSVPVIQLENSNPGESGFYKWVKLPFLAFKYARLLRKIGATHSFSLLSRPNYINIIARWMTRHPFKMIISERNYPSLQYGYGDLQSKVNRFLVKWLYPKADRIISNAMASSDDLVANFNCEGEKLVVIYNPIDQEGIDEITPVKGFFNPDYFNIINVGRLQGVKNHELLIRAIEPFGHVRLYILGEGALHEYLEELIRNLRMQDRVFLLGFDNNPYKYLKSANLFALGSNHEGFPNVLLEAMCCGLPILSTNCKSGPAEMMQLDKESSDDIMITPYGIISPVNDIYLMRKGLEYVIQHPDYLESCKVHVRRRIGDYNKEKILEAYEDALDI